MESSHRGRSRRDFIKTVAVAAGCRRCVGCMRQGGNVSNPRRGRSPAGKPEGLPITVAGYLSDRVEALANGSVPIEGCNVSFEEGSIGDLNTHIFSGPRSIEVTEIGLHPFMLAYANDDFRAYSLLPVFPLRLFRHKSVFIRTDRGSRPRGPARQGHRDIHVRLDIPGLAARHLSARVRHLPKGRGVGHRVKGLRCAIGDDLEAGADPAGGPHISDEDPRVWTKVCTFGSRRGGRPLPRR